MHRPNAASIADKMLFMVAAMAAEMELDLIRERTLDGLAAAEAQGRKGGRPPAVDRDTLAAIHQIWHAAGEPSPDRYRLTIDPSGHTIWLDDPHSSYHWNL